MKKKFDFIDNFKSKLKNVFNFKKNKKSDELEFEDEYEDEYDIDENDDEDALEGEEDQDEDFVPQPMTINRESHAEPEKTQEMKRPSFDQLNSEDSDEDDDETAEQHDDHEFTGEHSSVRKYKEFMLPKKSPLKKFGSLGGVFQKIKNLFAKKASSPAPEAGASKIIQKFRGKRENSKTSSLTWDELIQHIFHVDNRPKIHRTFIICLVAIGTYGLGKVIATVLEGQSSTQTQARNAPILQIKQVDHLRDLQTIARADLFNTQQKDDDPAVPIETKPTVDENLVCLAAQNASNLPITIKHTTVLQDSVKSVASVQVRGQKEILDIREGQKINNMAEIGKIDRQKVIFKNLSSGACEFIQLEDDKGSRSAQPIKVVSEERGRQIMKDAQPKGIRNEGNNFSIDKGLRDQMLSNISEVLTQARAVQIQNPDGSLAFKMTEIVPGSIYSQLNIQDGDIIEGINGDKITDLNAIMSMFGKIREIDNLSLTIKRNGTTRNYDYKFE